MSPRCTPARLLVAGAGCVECLASPRLSICRCLAIFSLLVNGKVRRLGEFDRERGTRAAEEAPVGKRTLVEQGSTRLPTAVVQRAPAASSDNRGPGVAAPQAGIDKPGFIDHSDGAFVRTAPREADGAPVRDKPLPPATRVFVSGTHPEAPQWWYVTAYIDQTLVRGYVQDLRVTTALPEPMAKLHQVVSGDTAEALAVQEYANSVRDGHDLRYYENALLHVNRQQGRAGVTGTYQSPGVLGGGGNNVQLVAGHRIWLVSPDYAKALESVVPDGSLTGGAVAKVKRFAGHIHDILHSVTESRHHIDEIAGAYAQVIRDHEAEIIGIVAGFLMAEAASALLAVVPAGVTQIAAAVIQLGLAAFGATGAVVAATEALKHGGQWLTLAWTAKGDDGKIAAASKEFLKMLVTIAVAALAALGAKTNYGNALKIANSMPTGGLPALALAGGGKAGSGAGVGGGVLIGPGTGAPGAGGAMMAKLDDDSGGNAEESGRKASDPTNELQEIRAKLESPENLSGKEKKALRARKKELEEQLGQTRADAPAEDVPAPAEFKKRVSGLSDKEAATDIPSWAREWQDARPGVNENGVAFATRMINKRYGARGWERTGRQGSEFSQLKKFGDRAFE